MKKNSLSGLAIVVLVATGIAGAGWWPFGSRSNLLDTVTKLGKSETTALLIGLAKPPDRKSPHVYFGGLCEDTAKAALGGDKTKWWLWMAVDPDGLLVACAIDDKKPSSGEDLEETFVRVDPNKTLDMKVPKGGNRKLRLITHVLDKNGAWRSLNTQTVENSKDPDKFKALVDDILNL